MAAKFRFDPDSLGRAQAKINAYNDKQKQKLIFALQNWALDTVARMQQELVELKAIDQGILSAATTSTQVTQTGTKLTVTVYNPLEYAVVIEWGRLPGGGRPPLLPIAGWAVRHGFTSVIPVNVSFGGEFSKAWAASGAILKNMEKGGGGKSSRKQKPMDPMTHDLLTVRLIARKIQERGFAGRHPFSIAWDERAAMFKSEIARMLQ